MMSYRQILLVCCVLFCRLLLSECRIYESNVSLLYGQADGALIIPGGLNQKNAIFGFGTEGTLDFELKCEPTLHKISEATIPDLRLLGCTTLEMRELGSIGRTGLNQACQKLQFPQNNVGRNFTMICQEIPMELVMDQSRQDGNLWVVHHYSERDVFLRFVLLQCPREVPNKTRTRVEEVQCEERLVLMNHNGRAHLSKDEVPLLPVYKILVMVWFLMLALWIGNWIKYRQYSNHLHKLLFVAPTFKFLLVTLTLVKWEFVAATGYENATLQMCQDMVQSTEVAVSYMTMLLAAEGWCVLRPRIRHIRCLLIPVLFLVFLGSNICVIWAHGYFLVFAMCSIAFVVHQALKWCKDNLEYLARQLLSNVRYVQQKLLRFRNVTIARQLTEKRNIYVRLRLVCFVYIVVFPMVITISAVVTEYTWTHALATEIPEILVFTAVGLIFRLRDFAPFENIEVILPKENSVIILLPFPNDQWPKRQKAVLGKPIDTLDDSSDETTRQS